MQKTVGILFVSLLFSALLYAQDTLPRFSVTARGTGKILISWHNSYPVVTQISIQRSEDSLKNFITLLNVPDPTLPANGAVDGKAPHPNFYYRLFVVLESGKYLFTSSRRPRAEIKASEIAVREEAVREDDGEQISSRVLNPRILFVQPTRAKDRSPATIKSPSAIHGSPETPEISVSSTVFVKLGDSIVGTFSGKQISAFRDSLLSRTRDTLVFIDGDTLLIKPFIPIEVYKISSFVYIGKYGNIHLSLPEAGKRHYSVKFFDDNNNLLFELSEIKDPYLILDKTDFHHAGWFRFELSDGGQPKEKNRLFIPKEF
jgi:hypothetical protein